VIISFSLNAPPRQAILLNVIAHCRNERSALLLGIVYMTFAIFPIIFEGVHGFNLEFVGLSYLGLGVGTIIGTATQYFWNRCVGGRFNRAID
jgi:hypothetical protein